MGRKQTSSGTPHLTDVRSRNPVAALASYLLAPGCAQGRVSAVMPNGENSHVVRDNAKQKVIGETVAG
jgi:hypothetical protein